MGPEISSAPQQYVTWSQPRHPENQGLGEHGVSIEMFFFFKQQKFPKNGDIYKYINRYKPLLNYKPFINPMYGSLRLIYHIWGWCEPPPSNCGSICRENG